MKVQKFLGCLLILVGGILTTKSASLSHAGDLVIVLGMATVVTGFARWRGGPGFDTTVSTIATEARRHYALILGLLLMAILLPVPTWAHATIGAVALAILVVQADRLAHPSTDAG